MADISFKDEAGGVHDEGMGWAPDGTFCGECSNITCVGCPSNNHQDEGGIENVSNK